MDKKLKTIHEALNRETVLMQLQDRLKTAYSNFYEKMRSADHLWAEVYSESGALLLTTGLCQEETVVLKSFENEQKFYLDILVHIPSKDIKEFISKGEKYKEVYLYIKGSYKEDDKVYSTGYTGNLLLIEKVVMPILTVNDISKDGLNYLLSMTYDPKEVIESFDTPLTVKEFKKAYL